MSFAYREDRYHEGMVAFNLISETFAAHHIKACYPVVVTLSAAAAALTHIR